MVLEREVGQPQRLAGADPRAHVGHVGVDVLAPERLRDRHAMVAVADEVQVADPVDGDRRERLAAPLGGRDPLPPARAPAGSSGGSRGRSRACGRRCRRPSRAGSSAARAASRRRGRAPRRPRRTAGSARRRRARAAAGGRGRRAAASAGRARSRPARPRWGSRCRRPRGEGYAASALSPSAASRRADQREDAVEAGDAERLDDRVGVAGDHEPPAARLQPAVRADQHAEAGGVDERRLA